MNKIMTGFILFLMFGCHNKKEKAIVDDLKYFYLSTVKWPDTFMETDSLMYGINMAALKIIVYYDSIDCVPCQLNMIPRWQQMIDETEKYSSVLSLVFIFNGFQKEEILESLKEYGFTLPFFHDPTGDFRKTNKLPKNKRYHTFLLDRDNKVILIGSPIGDSKLWDLYKKTIKNMLK